MLQMAVWNIVDAQGLTLSNVQNSGCLRENQRRANGEGQTRTIVLLKEGSILSVQLLNYEANCGTEGFDVTPNMSGGSDGTQCSVNIQVVPVGEEDMDCICPYNVSFTVYGLETNSFRFNCWWFVGQVSLTDGEPLTLESITEPVQIDDWYFDWYCIIDKVNHTAIVEGVDGGTSELLIPWVLSYEGEEYYVTGIGEHAFINYKALTSVTLPTNLTHIGDYAFAGCDNLTDVYCFADQVPTTGSNVFHGTPIASATLHVPAGMVDKYKATSPWSNFGNIVGEGEVTIDGLNYYLNSSFYTAPLTKGNTWEGELDIPSEISFYGQTYRVTSMALTAFRDNTKLTKVRIPKNLEGILHGYYTTNPYEDVPTGLISSDCMNPFIGCTALESIEVDEENQSLKSVDGVLFSQDGKGHYHYLTNDYYGTGLYCYPAGARRESYTIPNGVEWIGSGAFGHNQYLSSLTMPSSLKQICNNVFAGCNNLTDIYCYAENVPVAFDYAFKDFPIASATLHVPAGSVDKYKATAPWSGFGDIVAIEEIAQEYFPEGTKWTEIRLDTMKYDSWYSKVGDEWVPNFETIEYHVQGEFIDERTNDKYSCVYTNGQERTDSLTLLLYNHRIGNNDAGWYGEVTVAAFDNNGQLLWPFHGMMYPFSFEVGTEMSSLNIEIAGATGGGWPWEWDEYGTVEEIKEGDFGGVRPLKYSDVNGIRFIQGIGVASWNDGECIFGPIRPYEVLSACGAVESEARHYRSMLVHFERDGEVLYDVWPEINEPVTFTAGQMATIILPITPDASKGKYFKLDRWEDGKIVFEQELQPQARMPYIIVPNEDFSIDPSTLDLAGLIGDMVTIEAVDFIGLYEGRDKWFTEGNCFFLLDTTPDCVDRHDLGMSDGYIHVGSLRAFFKVRWSLSRTWKKLEYVLYLADGTTITSTAEPVTYTEGQMATIILPTAPDAGKGKYYRLDRCEGSEVIFEQELQPRARVPYIIVPSEDFSIDPSALDLEGLSNDTVSIDGISFIGTYIGEVLPSLGGEGGGSIYYYDFIDTTPDCRALDKPVVGALRAWLQVNWDDPIDHGGAKSPEEKKQIVLKDNPDGIEDNEELRLKNEELNAVYDLSGRRIDSSLFTLRSSLKKGIYIEDGRKKAVR